jgi:hypothetical protein
MKVTVNSVTLATSQKTNKSYQKVVFNGNQSASAFDDDFLPYQGKEVEVELSTKGNYTNIKLAGSKPAVHASEPPRDNNLDIRKSAYLLSLETLKATGQTITEQSLLEKAIKIEGYLTNGFTQSQG